MASIEYAAFVYDDAGDAINGATVNLYDRNDTATSRASTTTDSNGYYSITHATEGRFDIQITSGDSKRRKKYDDKLQYDELEVANFLIRNPADTFKYDIVPAAITADRALTLPLVAGNDTIAVIGFAQAWTADQTYNDNVNLTFGTGGDVDIDYDGTDLVINLTVVGSGDLVVNGGSIEFDDSEGVRLGAGKDAEIRFDGTDLIIITDGAGASGIILDSEDDTLEIKGSGTLQATFSTSGLNLASGDGYSIAGTSVLNATTLGSGVTGSSLTSVGTLAGLTLSADLDLSNNDLLNVGDAGNDWTTNRMQVSNSNNGATNDIRVRNTHVGTSSHAAFIVENGGADAGDALIDFRGAVDWSIGLDNSNGDILAFSNSSALGTNDRIRFAANGSTFTFIQNVTISANGNLMTLADVGTIEFDGSSSGTLTLTVPSSVTSHTLTWPSAQGSSGEQLENNGSGGLSWANAGSLREYKEIVSVAPSPEEALDEILGTEIYNFHFKKGFGTKDYDTLYVGPMADEAPWAMHHGNTIVNPINTLGYMVQGFKALGRRIAKLEAELAGRN